MNALLSPSISVRLNQWPRTLTFLLLSFFPQGFDSIYANDNFDLAVDPLICINVETVLGVRSYSSQEYLITSVMAADFIISDASNRSYRIFRGHGYGLCDHVRGTSYIDLTCDDIGTTDVTVWSICSDGFAVDFCESSIILEAGFENNCADYPIPPDADNDLLIDFTDNHDAGPVDMSDSDGDGICDSEDRCPGCDDADMIDLDEDGCGDVCPCENVSYYPPTEIPERLTCSEAVNLSAPDAYYSNLSSVGNYSEAQELIMNMQTLGACDRIGAVSPEISQTPGPCGGEMIITYAFPEVCDQPELNAIVSIMVDPAPEAFVLLPTVSSISCADAATFTPPNAHYSNDPNDIIISSIGGAEFVTAADPLAEACILKGELEGTIITQNYDKCGGTIGVLYTGTDACGREVESPLIFFPIDAAADPAFVNVPANVELPCEDLPINGSGDRFWPTSALDYTNGEGGLCEIAGQVTSQIFGTIDCNNGSVLTEEWLVELCPSTDGGRAVEYASASRTITILPDRTPPRLQGIPPNTEVDCAEELPAWPDVIATDNLDPDVEIIREEVPGYAGCGGGFFERIFTAIDDAGNRSTSKYTIRFTDEIAPTLTIPADTTLICGEMVPEPSYKAEDNCSSTQLDYTEDRTDHNPCEYTLVRTWKVRDGCGNSVTKSQTINVIDVEAPVITPVNEMLVGVPNGGSVAMYSCAIPEALMSDVQVSDNCCNLSDGQAGLSLVVEDRKLSANVCDVFGYYSSWRCTYTATDAAGNISVYQFDVHQYDTVAPILERVPANLAVDSLGAVPDFDMSVTAIDECSGEVPVMVASGLIMNPDNLDQQLITRSWSATDQCGNRASADQQIYVGGFDSLLMTSSIGDLVWFDENANGARDVGESGADDIKLHLYRYDALTQSMMLWDSTLTATRGDSSGYYQFDRLFPGNYQIEVFPSPTLVSIKTDSSRTEFQKNTFGESFMTAMVVLDTQAVHLDLDIALVEMTVLPVDLNSFTGSNLDCSHQLNWSTLSEESTKHFEVQQAGDALDFETIAVIQAKSAAEGSSYQVKNYSGDERSYYRLKVVNLDRTETTTDAFVLDKKCNATGVVKVYPNPFREEFTLEVEKDLAELEEILIVDQLGRVVKNILHPTTVAFGNRVSLPNVSSGHYVLQLRFQDRIETQKLVKVK